MYGVPIERPLMVFMFRLMGYNIREHHFSTERHVAEAAERALHRVRLHQTMTWLGPVYEIGHFVKP